ncbi:zinc finger domain-containing protein [Streptomyces sp. NRRL F-5630]|uniref:zinc finger domain-containing protein n=1 Tax=Streptomyces sp. NRRL F-5630 TaxID=1463864 RepID=UPI003D709806
MDVQEVIRLLGEISLVDDRVVKTDEAEQKAQVRMWAVALSEVPLDFAGEAVGRHYAESAWPIMPKDITARWRDTVRERLSRQVGTFEPTHHPDLDPDDKYGNAYVAALRAGRTAVMTGAEQPRELPELVGRIGRTVEAAPATEGYLAAKAALFPKAQRPAGAPELAVRCRTCGVDAGRRCKTLQRGREMQGTHPDRKSDFEAGPQGAVA